MSNLTHRRSAATAVNDLRQRRPDAEARRLLNELFATAFLWSRGRCTQRSVSVTGSIYIHSEDGSGMAICSLQFLFSFYRAIYTAVQEYYAQLACMNVISLSSIS